MIESRNDKPLRLAAPAPIDDEYATDVGDGADEAAAEAAATERPDIDELCVRWNEWRASRRFWAKPSLPVSVLGKLRTKGVGRSVGGGPDAPLDAELQAFHQALLGQPEDALARRVFELHYVWRVRDVKRTTEALKISRAHYYRLLTAFRLHVWRASREILKANLAAAAVLPSKVEERQ